MISPCCSYGVSSEQEVIPASATQVRHFNLIRANQHGAVDQASIIANREYVLKVPPRTAQRFDGPGAFTMTVILN